MDGLRIAALEQLVFVLQYEVVQLLVTGHHRWGQEQMGLEHFPIPDQNIQMHLKTLPALTRAITQSRCWIRFQHLLCRDGSCLLYVYIVSRIQIYNSTQVEYC